MNKIKLCLIFRARRNFLNPIGTSNQFGLNKILKGFKKINILNKGKFKIFGFTNFVSFKEKDLVFK